MLRYRCSFTPFTTKLKARRHLGHCIRRRKHLIRHTHSIHNIHSSRSTHRHSHPISKIRHTYLSHMGHLRHNCDATSSHFSVLDIQQKLSHFNDFQLFFEIKSRLPTFSKRSPPYLKNAIKTKLGKNL